MIKLSILNATPAILNLKAFIPSAFAILASMPTQSWANGDQPSSPQAVETLPDGNLRDPMPASSILSELSRISLKNMVAFEAGSFEMGDWGEQVNEDQLPFDGSGDSKPLHNVKLSRFSIMKFPVTYAEFDIFTAALRLPRINQRTAVKKYRKPNNPAGVTWQGANDYCKWLGQLTNKPIALPTEAQWEYAARSGGKRHVYPTDNGKREMGRNLPDYDQRQLAGGLTGVSDFPSNMAGIYYMSAGVHEWINDWYDASYYSNSPVQDPKGPDNGTKHVVRGHFGDGGSDMSFKRWSWATEKNMKSWKKYSESPTGAPVEIPSTKYSASAENAFRCALN